MSFPPGFIWGAASSSYQIEGGAKADGKGPSVWDTMCQKSGAIFQGHTGDVACDHYNRYREDVALMKGLGLGAYRFSISWPRVLPQGTGEVNPEGLGFYDRLVDELLASGMTPYATLFHWDFPQALYARGGWLNRASAEWFAEYATVVVHRLSDRVTNWITINEPQVLVHNGHRQGNHAPGDKLEIEDVLLVGHNVLRAHGKAVQAIRAASQSDCQIGYAPVGVVKIPASDRQEDIQAACRAMFTITCDTVYNNAWWMDPLVLGKYPDDGLRLYGRAAPEIHQGDLEDIHQPLDFLGLNIYHGEKIRAGDDGDPERVEYEAGDPFTSFGSPVTPEALYWGPKLFWEKYRIPIVVTENGMSGREWISLDGKVHDPQRIDFLQRYLLQLRAAVEEGADVRGYLCWSIIDNFEWAEGYQERFGLIFVDYATQNRVLKDSAHWYKRVIASNGDILDSGYEKIAGK